jgi:RNase H-like domain found in reverse transcriptase
VDKAKVEVIERLSPPSNVKDIKSFLGHTRFYHIFIQDFSKIARPLTNLIIKNTVFEFDNKYFNAFCKLKEAIVLVSILQPPNWNLSFEIMCDATDYVVGAILE